MLNKTYTKLVLQLGCLSIRQKPVRFIVAVILSAVVLSIFSLTVAIISFDRVRVAADIAYQNNNSFLRIQKFERTDYVGGWPSFIANWEYAEILQPATAGDRQFIEQQTNRSFASVFIPRTFLSARYGQQFYQVQQFVHIWQKYYPDLYIHFGMRRGWANISQGFIADAGYTLYGRLPVGKEEVVIDKIDWNAFLVGDHVYEGVVTEINAIEDIIGLKITVPFPDGVSEGSYGSFTEEYIDRHVTVVGVIDTNAESNIDDIGETIEERVNLYGQFFISDEVADELACQFSYRENIYTHIGKAVLLTPVGNLALREIRSLLSFFDKHKDGDFVFSPIGDARISWYSKASLYGLRNTAFVIACVMSVFSILLFYKFASISINLKQKQFGLLRAMGSGKKSILFICIIEMILCALINFGFSLLSSFFLVGWFERWAGGSSVGFDITFFSLNFITALSLLLFGTATIALSYGLPLWRITRKSPAKIIKDSFG